MRARLVSLLALCCLAGPLSAAGLAPHLVKDINTGFASSSSFPSDYITVGGVTFFTADDGETGGELWRTDGTPGGTYQLADICPGPCTSYPSYYSFSDHSYFFRALDGDGFALWVSSGTPASTFKLASVAASGTLQQDHRWVPGLGLFFFAAGDGVHPFELWRSDGTPGGTFQVAGPQGSDPREMTVYKDRLYFVADDPQRGPILWKSDGTPQGTQVVVDPVPGSASHIAPTSLRAAGKFLYFVAPTPAHGVELWKSDGTTRGTAPLTDLVPGAGSPVLSDFVPLGNRLFFVADDGKTGQELWATDGTPRGTKKLTNFAAAQAFPGFGDFLYGTLLGSRLIFPANDGIHGTELWTTDGTPGGTKLLKDVCPGPCSGASFVSQPFGKYFLFSGYTPARGTEPWVSDGTPAGTHLLRDLCRGDCSSVTTPYFFYAENQAFFVPQDPDGGFHQIWRTDGTSSGTFQVANPHSLVTPPGGGFAGAVLGTKLVFSADDGEHGSELWRSDGTVQGTGLLADINSRNIASSYPDKITAVGNTVFFFAVDGRPEIGLWKSDGSEAGTSLVHRFPADITAVDSNGVQAGGKLVLTLRSSSGGYNEIWRSDGTDSGTLRLTPDGFRGANDLCAVGGTVFFVAADDDHGNELWKTDGTPAGTVMVKDLEPGFIGSNPQNLTAFKGKLYFTARTSDLGDELWVSDGTVAGTHIVKDIAPEPDLASPGSLTVAGSRLWFTAAPDGFDRQLWSTDGTEAGTVPADLVPGSTFEAEGIVSDGTRLLLTGHTSDTDEGLWLTDGTAAGTRRLGALRLDSPYFSGNPVTLGGELYFAADSLAGSFNYVLWKSDGTPEGTAPVFDPASPISVKPDFLQVFAGRLAFTTSQGDLWQSDGTQAGTTKLRALAGPGESGDLGWPLVPAGSRLFFRSDDHDTGEELWALDPP